MTFVVFTVFCSKTLKIRGVTTEKYLKSKTLTMKFLSYAKVYSEFD